MTPQRDAAIREKAQAAYDFAVAELAQFECPEGVNYMTWIDSPEYRAASEYRSWLYDVRSFAAYRRRHPIVRLLKRSQHIGPRYYPKYGEAEMFARFGCKYEESPLNLPAKREPSYAFRWRWTDDSDDDLKRQTHAPAWSWGDTFVLALPDIHHAGCAFFYANHDRLSWEIGWNLGPKTWSARHLGVSISIDGEDRDIAFRLMLPMIGSLYLTLNRMAPVWLTFPKERRYTTYEPYVFPSKEAHEAAIANVEIKPVEHRYMMGQDVAVIEFDLSSEHVSGALWSVGEHMQSEGKRRFYAFWPDWLLGRTVCTTEKIGPPIQAVACFPEGRYTLTLQRETRTWKRPRWPWPYWRKSVDITLERPPEFQGKGESDYDCGPDAIYGMGSDGHSFENAVATYIKAVLKERAKRGILAPEHRTVLTETSA